MKKVALALSFLFVTSVSRADQLYAVNGSLAVVGNNTCSGSCVETINFSFDFSEQVGQYGLYYLSIVPNSSSIVSSGPLGVFGAPVGPFGLSPAGGPGGPSVNYIEFRSGSPSDFSEIDIWTAWNGLPGPFVPQITGADLWACGTQSCVNDFIPSGSPYYGVEPPVYDIFLHGTVHDSAVLVSTPEPSTLTFLVVAFLALFLLRIRAERPRASSPKFLE